MQLLISKHSRGCVPSAPCRGREHGREMVWIIIGQKSTNTRRHSEREREGGRYPREPGAAYSTIRLTTKLPEPMVKMNKITPAEEGLAPNKQKIGRKTVNYRELDSPLFSWTLNMSVPQSPPCLLLQQQGLAPTPPAHTAAQKHEGSHGRTGNPRYGVKMSQPTYRLTAEQTDARPTETLPSKIWTNIS